MFDTSDDRSTSSIYPISYHQIKLRCDHDGLCNRAPSQETHYDNFSRYAVNCVKNWMMRWNYRVFPIGDENEIATFILRREEAISTNFGHHENITPTQ